MTVHDPDQRRRGIAAAVRAVRRGTLVVMPTDTVYGLGCDAFGPEAVAALLAAKGRGRDVPVPILVGSVSTLGGVSVQTGGVVSDLVEAAGQADDARHRQQPSLHWDLGDAGGTVAVRMPLRSRDRGASRDRPDGREQRQPIGATAGAVERLSAATNSGM